MPTKRDQVVETLSPQFLGIEKVGRSTVLMVNLQFLATAASLAAIVVSVKPLLAFQRPSFRRYVLTVTVLSLWFHGENSKGGRSPLTMPIASRATPRDAETRQTWHSLANF